MDEQDHNSEVMGTTTDQVPVNPERPATVFLSYIRKDAQEVASLQQQLKIRGVWAWRDVTDLALGSFFDEEIIHAIEQECDAFLLYLTPQSFSSRVIWDVEVPAALRRWEKNHAFGIIPVLQGITIVELRQFCADRGYPSLADFHGAFVPEPDTTEAKETISTIFKEIARSTLKATLGLRLRRIMANRSYQPYLCLRTFPYTPPTNNLDLDLDWTELFTDLSPTGEEWQNILLPALHDIKNTLSAMTPSRTLHLLVQARLPAAIALGSAFPTSAHFNLIVTGRHGSWSTETVPSDQPVLRRMEYINDGDPNTAVMEVAITRDIALSVTQSLPLLGLSFGHRIRFVPLEGPNNEAVKGPAQASAMARQVGRELKRLRDREGVRCVHLFAALPAPLAVMLGHQLNASAKVILYFTDGNGYYVPSCTLGNLSM